MALLCQLPGMSEVDASSGQVLALIPSSNDQARSDAGDDGNGASVQDGR